MHYLAGFPSKKSYEYLFLSNTFAAFLTTITSCLCGTVTIFFEKYRNVYYVIIQK